MNVVSTSIEGVLLLEPRVHHDPRGRFLETWNEERYRSLGIPGAFVQDNLSWSRRGVLRGLHFQSPAFQGKLVTVLQGEVHDVAVDLRRGSPTFGRWVAERLSDESHRQLWIPEGFAHGFAVTSETAIVGYKCTRGHDPAGEITLRWDDPDLAIDWPLDDPLVSEKDTAGVRLRDLPADRLGSWTGRRS